MKKRVYESEADGINCSAKICKDCKFYKREVKWYGKCSKEFWGEKYKPYFSDEIAIPKTDIINFIVGENFGCIHFENREVK